MSGGDDSTAPRLGTSRFCEYATVGSARRSELLAYLTNSPTTPRRFAPPVQKSDRFPESVFCCVTSSRAFRGSGPGARGAIGPEIEDDILLRVVTRPGRQARAVRVAVLGEVDPVALRHPGDRQILGRRRRRPGRPPACRRRRRFRRRAGRRRASAPASRSARRRNGRGRRATRWPRTRLRRSAPARPGRSRHWPATPGWRASVDPSGS